MYKGKLTVQGDDPLRELSRILKPGVPDEALPPILAVGVYCDESETNDPRIFTLAGWVAVPTAWGHFNEAWRDMLCSTGPYPVSAFHMADIAPLKGLNEFDGWPRTDRERLIERATDILLDERLMAIPYAVACTIVVDDFQKLIPDWRPTVEDLYVFCYERLFWQVLTWERVQADVLFVFDKKKRVEHQVKERFDRAKNQLGGRDGGLLDDCLFRDDRTVLPLQAADYLAYEVRRSVYQAKVDPDRDERTSYTRLKTRPHTFRCYDHQYIEKLLRAAEETGKSLNELAFTVEASED